MDKDAPKKFQDKDSNIITFLENFRKSSKYLKCEYFCESGKRFLKEKTGIVA